VRNIGRSEGEEEQNIKNNVKEIETEMRRYFDLPDSKNTLLVEAKAGSAAALAEPEKIRDHFKQPGAIREIERDEYVRLTRIYNGHILEPEKDDGCSYQRDCETTGY